MNKQAYEHMVGLALDKKAFWGAVLKGGVNLAAKGLKYGAKGAVKGLKYGAQGAAKGSKWTANKGLDALKFKNPATLRMGTQKAVGAVQNSRTAMNQARHELAVSMNNMRHANGNYRQMMGYQKAVDAARSNLATATKAYGNARSGLARNVAFNKTVAGIPNAIRTGVMGVGGYYMGKGMGLWGNGDQQAPQYTQGGPQGHMMQPDQQYQYQNMNPVQMANQQAQAAQGRAWYDVPGHIYDWWAN